MLSLHRAACALLLWSITACTGEPSTPQPTADAGPTTDQGRGNEPTAEQLGGARDTLVIASGSDFDTTLSVVYQSVHDSNLITGVYGQVYNATFDCKITYEPELYESWSVDPTGTILTIKIRPGLVWADGTPFTTRDVKFTYDLVADPAVASPRMPYVQEMVEGKRPLIVDDLTAEFHFTRPLQLSLMLGHTGLAPVPEHLLRDADRASLRGHPLGRTPVALGPWKVAKWEAGSSVVLEPNDRFGGPAAMRPRLSRVVYRIIPEYSSRLLALKAGEVDWMEGILVADADRLATEHPELTLHRRGWRNMDYIAWNSIDPSAKAAEGAARPAHPLFGDRAVRKALSLAVNVDKMIADMFTASNGEVYGRRSVSTITPGLCEVHNNDITPLPFDPAAARAALEAAGWKDTDADGLLDRGGQPFRFKLLLNAGNQRRATAALIAQENLKAVGVDMQIEQVETNTFFERLRKKDFDAALSGWSSALFVDMTAIWASGEDHEYNFVSYNNPEADRLMAEALASPDEARSNELHKQVQALIYEDQPYTFLYWFQDIVAVHQRFKDEQVNMLSAQQDLYRWWVPAAEVKYPR